ncbi:hypothetical protein H0E87_024821 [Populus deltoides]|uniref:Uncharacterized protein n=1 Tax=Populus deltoides TaxID=3696 RepID=A0A8T2X6U6_POPDE|nr:hypothetical protein H0E87_024821 [Populus deltoides]
MIRRRGTLTYVLQQHGHRSEHALAQAIVSKLLWKAFAFYSEEVFRFLSVYLFILPNTVSFFGKFEVKDHQRFQASFATTLKACMTALKKMERMDREKAAEGDKKERGLKKSKKA